MTARPLLSPLSENEDPKGQQLLTDAERGNVGGAYHEHAGLGAAVLQQF